MSLTREYCSAIERAADLMNHGIHFASFSYGGLYQFAIKRQTFVLPLPTGLRSEVSHAKGAAFGGRRAAGSGIEDWIRYHYLKGAQSHNEEVVWFTTLTIFPQIPTSDGFA